MHEVIIKQKDFRRLLREENNTIVAARNLRWQASLFRQQDRNLSSSETVLEAGGLGQDATVKHTAQLWDEMN